MLVPALAAMMPQTDPIILDPGAANTTITDIGDNANLAAISRRQAPGRWAYSADTLAALNDAATAASAAQATEGKGTSSTKSLKGKEIGSSEPVHSGISA